MRIAKGQKLLSWSNEGDDGRGILHGTQHGATQIITSCDGDDPACSFHSTNRNYDEGYWTSRCVQPLPPPPLATRDAVLSPYGYCHVLTSAGWVM